MVRHGFSVFYSPHGLGCGKRVRPMQGSSQHHQLMRVVGSCHRLGQEGPADRASEIEKEKSDKHGSESDGKYYSRQE